MLFHTNLPGCDGEQPLKLGLGQETSAGPSGAPGFRQKRTNHTTMNNCATMPTR